MKLRNILSLAAATVALIGLGCGGDSDSTADGGASGASGGKPTIAVSIPSADHGWTGGVVYWAEQAKKDFADVADIQIQQAGTADEQVGQVQAFTSANVDGMVILAHNSGPLTPAAGEVSDRGIYLVSVDRGFDEPVANVYIAGDNAAFGRESAKYVAERMKERGETNLVILTGIEGNIVNASRVEAAKEVFAEYPEINILAEQPGDWSREKSTTVMQGILAGNPDIDAVWCQDDDMAEGVEQAINEAGRQGIWIFGGAGKKQIVERVMNSDETFPATMTYPPGMIYAGIAVAVAELTDGGLEAADDDLLSYLGVTREQLAEAKGKDGQQEITLDVALVTPDNAEEYYFPDSLY